MAEPTEDGKLVERLEAAKVAMFDGEEPDWKAGAKAIDEAIAAMSKLSEMRSALESANRYLDFVARWAWREGPHLDDEQRLSSIKYHPAIKARVLGAQP